MVLGRRGRSFSSTAFGPVARLLVRLQVSPDVVTVAGTLATAAIAFGLLARGHLVSGSLLLGVVLLTDSIDGLMARELGRNSPWGAFLDSTMDRLGDASIYIAIALYALSIPGTLGAWTFGFSLAVVPLAIIVSYARARAEAVGLTAAVGIAERADRLLYSLLGCLLVGLGLPVWVLTLAMGYVAAASTVTVVQRMRTVYLQAAGVRHAA